MVFDMLAVCKHQNYQACCIRSFVSGCQETFPEGLTELMNRVQIIFLSAYTFQVPLMAYPFAEQYNVCRIRKICPQLYCYSSSSTQNAYIQSCASFPYSIKQHIIKHFVVHKHIIQTMGHSEYNVIMLTGSVDSISFSTTRLFADKHLGQCRSPQLL